MRMTEMDQNVPLAEQVEAADGGGPVVLVNKFEVDAADVDQFMAAWADDAAYFKSQPGYISAQLHQGIAGSGVFLNVAVWESVGHFRNAFGAPEFRARLSRYPSATVASPHLFRKLAVPNICVA